MVFCGAIGVFVDCWSSITGIGRLSDGSPVVGYGRGVVTTSGNELGLAIPVGA